MLYLLVYFSILALVGIITICFTSINGLYDDDANIEDAKQFGKLLKRGLIVFSIMAIISITGLFLVRTTYYLEPITTSKNEIVSITTNNTKAFCKYIDENGNVVSKEIKLHLVDLGEFKKNEKGWKITEYVVYTKTEMNPILHKILTFGHLPKEKVCYKIEK